MMMTNYKIRRPLPKDVQFSQKLIAVKIASGIPHVDELSDELDEMRDILLDRLPCPIDSPYLSLMEVATAYYCRGQEIDQLIHRGERDGVVARGSQLYKFRTGELRSFLELTKMAANLGSRRLTQEQMLQNMREVT